MPEPQPTEVLIQVAAVGVCGSDVHYYEHGRIGDETVNRPLILGHELSGTIVQVGELVSAARIGERVAVEPQRPCRSCSQCLSGRYNLCPLMEFYATPPIDGAFSQFVTIESIFAHQVPNIISFEAAALVEPLSVAIAAVRKAQIKPGSSVLIAGAGPIGIIIAQTARAFGANRIVVSDLVPERRQRALQYGATETIDPLTNPPAPGKTVDAFIDASGASAAVKNGVLSVGPAGYVVLVGLGHEEMNLPVARIQNLEITVTGVFRYTNTWPVGIELLTSQQINLDNLVTGKFDLSTVKEALESNSDPNSLKSIVYPNGIIEPKLATTMH